MSDLIPDGWEIKSISNIAKIGSSKRILQSEYVANGVPFFRSREAILRSKRKTITNPLYIARERFEELKGKFGVPIKDEILVTAVGTIGVIYLIEDIEFYFKDGNLLWIREIDKKVSPNYLAKYLSSDVFQESIARITSGSSQSALTIEKLSELEFNLPPLPEQKKIAAILTSVDEVIEKTQAQINKLKDLKTGMMQELLTCGVGVDGKPHTEFKDSPVGRIPMAWDVELIGNLFSVQLGKMLSKASKITDSPLSYLGNKNIQWGRVVIDDLEKMDFSEKEKQKFSLETGDLLMCEGGDVGRCAIWMNEISDCYYQKAIHRLRPIENRYKPVLLMEYMKFAKENGLLVDYISQTSIAHLTKEKLISIPVPVPSITEQEVIIRVLETLSNRLKVADGKLKKNRNLKKALMQDLLTGKVRVKVDSE
uniref:Type-1 restriction enzyme EcoKI specificity protein n=1 Tax=Aliivibrio wodanis TaxID=80852 RepID=A0A5Q4ZR12_9GAMM|nr:Type-1 restriction enzyme EcoKI specificity protein [Aliivibrio wodanis]